MSEWNALINLKQTKYIPLDRLKERSKKVTIVYIFVADYCGHCKEFKKNTYDRLVAKIENTCEYKLCDVGESDYYLKMLQSAKVERIPSIIVFNQGIMKVYTPDEFMEKF